MLRQDVANGVAEFSFIGTAQEDRRSSEFSVCPQGDAGEFFGGPAFRFPTGAGADGEPRSGKTGELIDHDGVVVRSKGEFGIAAWLVRKDDFGHAPIALPSGNVMTCVGEQGGAEDAGAFAGGFEAPAVAGAGGGRHKPRAQKTLQVDDEIEITLTQFSHQSPQIDGAAVSMKGDSLVDVGVIFEQICEIRVDDPANLGIREACTQGGEDRQCLEDIAEGAWLDDANAFG